MSARLFLLIFLPASFALGNEKELFEPLADPDQTWEHYTGTFFPTVTEGSGVLHFVRIPTLEQTVECLSIMWEPTGEGNRYFLFTGTFSKDGELRAERKQLEIPVELSSSLRILSSAALEFTGETPLPPERLDGEVTLLFVHTVGRPVGKTNSPGKGSVPGRVVRFFEALWEDLEDERIEAEAWTDRSRSLRDDFPELDWPTYSESRREGLLKEELEVMKDWRMIHRVESLYLDGFKDSESLQFREELASALAELAPDEWKGLMRSSGNMHNPRVHPIYPYVDQATCLTPTVQRLNGILAEYQLKVSGLSFEKLSFATKTRDGLPSAIMRFVVEAVE